MRPSLASSTAWISRNDRRRTPRDGASGDCQGAERRGHTPTPIAPSAPIAPLAPVAPGGSPLAPHVHRPVRRRRRRPLHHRAGGHVQSLRLLQVDGTLSAARPSILLTGKIPSSVIARLEQVGDVDRFQREGVDVIPHDELVARVAGKQAIVSMITDAVDRQVIEAGGALKVIANAAVGYNNIDVTAARERGIIVTNTPGVLTDATADLTWALILGITRRIGEGERLIRRGEWRGWTFDFMLGAELGGKQLGIVGYGGIGRAVAARGRALGRRIAYTSRTSKNDPDAEAMALDRLLATSDVVSLHCPLTSETRH